MHEVCQCDTEAKAWNDFSPKAKWRGLFYTPKELAKNQLCLQTMSLANGPEREAIRNTY